MYLQVPAPVLRYFAADDLALVRHIVIAATALLLTSHEKSRGKLSVRRLAASLARYCASLP